MKQLNITPGEKHKKLYRIISLVFSLNFFYGAYRDWSLVKLVAALLFVFYFCYNSEVILNSEGFTYKFSGLGFNRVEIYPFSQIDKIYLAEKKGKCVVLLVKGSDSNKLSIEPKMKQEVLDYLETVGRSAVVLDL